jgi:hypothetical protein
VQEYYEKSLDVRWTEINLSVWWAHNLPKNVTPDHWATCGVLEAQKQTTDLSHNLTVIFKVAFLAIRRCREHDNSTCQVFPMSTLEQLSVASNVLQIVGFADTVFHTGRVMYKLFHNHRNVRWALKNDEITASRHRLARYT